jgi:hypothetical protein
LRISCRTAASCFLVISGLRTMIMAMVAGAA